MAVTPIVLLATAVAMVAGSLSEEEKPASSGQGRIVSSTHQTAAAPEQSAHCVAKNARQSGSPASEIYPLYGMARVAVIMRATPTGDTLAVASLEPANPGSTVRIDTTTFVKERDTLVSQLLQGC